jgi:tRNA(Ile)-lysidine synthase
LVPLTNHITPEKRVLRFIRDHKLVTPGRKLLVAVSGGPDSVCLLSILAGLREELGIELHVAHLNHRLRGDDADADVGYVAELSRRLGIPASVESRDVRAYKAQHHTSLEEAAREVRYSFLAQVAVEVGAESVAVGHSADDHVETILMHLIRGSGTRGLRGLQPVSRLHITGTDLVIIRPLLELSREETTGYCRQHGLNPRTDASNYSLTPFRNRIRHELLPQLQKYNPQIAKSLLRTARIAADDLDFIDIELAGVWGKITRKESDSIIFDKESLNKLSPSLVRHAIRAAIESLLGNLRDIEAVHIEDIIDALDKPAGKVICLPDGLNFTVEYDRYILGTDSAALSPFPALGAETIISVPGNTTVPGWDVEAAVIAPSAVKNIEKEADDFSAFFDYQVTGNRLTVRCRKPGDRFQPLGMEKPKKLNEYMIDARIPRTWRRRIPLVVSPEQIVWVVGWRMDERVKVTDKTGEVLHLQFKRCD